MPSTAPLMSHLLKRETRQNKPLLALGLSPCTVFRKGGRGPGCTQALPLCSGGTWLRPLLWDPLLRPELFGWPNPLFRSDLTQLNFLKAHFFPSQGVFWPKHYRKWNVVLQVTCSRDLCRRPVCPKEMVFCR